MVKLAIAETSDCYAGTTATEQVISLAGDLLENPTTVSSNAHHWTVL